MAGSEYSSPEIFAARLADPNITIKLKLTIAINLRDSIEAYQNADYSHFLKVLIPVLKKILEGEPPVFDSNSEEQKLRNLLLEVLYRLPQNDSLKTYATELLQLLMHLLRIENEENAVICLKIIIELHRSYKLLLEDQVQPFLDIVKEMYVNMEQAVKDAFDSPGSSATPGASTPIQSIVLVPSSRPTSPVSDVTTNEAAPNKVLARSLHSFKVLTECPIIVVLLFQSYRKSVNTNIQNFVPLIIKTLGLQARPQAEAQEASRAKGEIFVGVAPGIKDRAKYTEFIVTQVKTMSFLAYVLRAYKEKLSKFQDLIPDFVIRLLQDCPPEASATRKELLVATRHILSTEFRDAFINKIDILLDEKVLVGTGVTPIAYSMLADLVHHVRNKLTPMQLSKTVYMYSRNLHDPTLAAGIQTMCSKLLLNLTECIVNIPKRDDKNEARELLIKILDTFATKFTTLNLLFMDYQRYHQKMKSSESNDDSSSEKPVDYFDFEQARPIHTASPSELQQDIISEGRFLFRNLVSGLKPIIIGLRQTNPQPSANSDINLQVYNSVARGFSQEQIDIFVRLFRDGVCCFDYFVENLESSQIKLAEKLMSLESSNRIVPLSKFEKDALEHFSSAFFYIDPAIFQEIFASQMRLFFEKILQNPSLLQIPQLFLASNEVISQNFAGILLRYLVDRLDMLGRKDKLNSSIMLRLFKLAFMSVTAFPNQNEMVLHPHLANIITSSMKLSAKAKEPFNYFMLLRILFRSIGGGRFENLYKEVLPLLPMLLEGLNTLLSLTNKQRMRDLFVELCLTVPVRLSVLLPYLGYLMKPLVLALQAGTELVTQGLRTLELCIDNLTAEFLDPIMAPVINDLMHSLWKHLKPSPYNQSHSLSTTRILGKLGGRNRRMLKDPPQLETNIPSLNGLDIQIYFDPSPLPHSFSLDECLSLAIRTLQDTSVTAFHKKHAYKFISATIPLLFDVNEGNKNLANCISERLHQEFLSNVIGEDNTESMNTTQTTHLTDNICDNMDVDLPNNENVPSQSTIPKKIKKEGHKQILRRKYLQEDTLQNVIVALFVAASLPELKEQAWPFLQNICRHFALLEVGEAIDFRHAREKRFEFYKYDKTYNLENKVMVEALVEVMTSENSDLRELAASALKIMYETCILIIGKKEVIYFFPTFHVLASRFCSCCYKQEWYRKSGGCMGISVLSSQVDMGTQWMMDHQLEFVKSLLFILKDMSSEFSAGYVDNAAEILLHVLKVCNRIESVSGDDIHMSDFHAHESSDKLVKFDRLITLLVTELSNANATVRETVQSAFYILAEITKKDVTILLSKARDNLLNPIFGKPLRALPPSMQIGHIDAITFCLSLQPPFLDFHQNEELVRLLNEALQLADAEDQNLVSRTTQLKNSASAINLRIVCIKLLSAAMARSESFPPNTAATIRARIITVFFRSLYSRAPEVVEVANKGLQQVLQQQHKLPKDLLQAGLRPILVNLSDHKKLTVQGLDGLARLLELLTNYFKVEIGKKLLDHLLQWAEPNILQEAAGKPLIEVEPIRIIVAILNVFHLLPSAAHIFLKDLVPIVLNLEEKLRRSKSSPFRLPLIKFLNRYSSEAIEYFYDKIGDSKFSRLFVNLLGAEEATKLRQDIMAEPVKLITKTSSIQDSSNPDEAKFQRIVIIRKIVKYHPNWLIDPSSVPILDCLKKAWHDPGRLDRLKREDTLSFAQTRESKYLVEIFISYLKVKPDDYNLLFDLVTIFSHGSVIDYTFLKKFYQEEVAMKYTVEQKRIILDKFLDTFDDPFLPACVKKQSLRIIITPMLLYSFSKGREHGQIIETKQMDKIQNLWHYLADTHDEIEDSLRIEVLQFSTLLVQRVPHIITTRSSLAKFGWNWSKVDDITAKQAAFVFLAHICAEFDSINFKIMFQSYGALLRAHQPEARTLVKQALDILAPVVPKYKVPGHTIDEKRDKNKKTPPPTWIHYTKKVLLEDGHSVSQLVNVYQMLVRHPGLFYEYREHFMPQIANTLTRLGLLQNATAETRTLTIDLSELILKWEKRRIVEYRSQDHYSNNSSASTPVATPEKRRYEAETEFSPRKRQLIEHSGELRGVISDQNSRYIPNLGLRENVISYLVRFVCTSTESVTKTGLTRKALELIKEFLNPEFWPEVNVKLNIFDRTLKTDISQNTVDSICNSLDVLDVILSRKPADWCITNIENLRELLERSIRSNNIRIQKCLHPVLVQIYKALAPLLPVEPIVSSPEPQPIIKPETDVDNFTKVIHTTIQDGLQNLDNLYSVMMLLKAVGDFTPRNIDSFLPGIIQVVQKLTKDITTPVQNSTSNGGNIQVVQKLAKDVTTPNPESPVDVLIMSLQLVNSRISELNESRQAFLISLSQLIEKSKYVELSRSIFEMVKEWVSKKAEPYPTMEEKGKILDNMLCYESLEDKSLIEDYLDLVIKIYSDHSFTRSELTVKLEKAFLMGTRYGNPKLRNRFMDKFDHSLPKILSTRLSYVISIQNWEYLSNYFWIHQALDILLGSISSKKKIQPPFHCLQTKAVTEVGVPSCTWQSSNINDEFREFMDNHQNFLSDMKTLRVSDLLSSLKQLHRLDDNVAYKFWVDLFPICWSAISNKDRQELTDHLVSLLSRGYHLKQIDERPSCVQALLDGISRCAHVIKLPPHLIKYLGKSHGAWHISMEMLQRTVCDGDKEDEKYKDSTLDALADLYSSLTEDDMYYGLWRRRCKFSETNTAVSYEQSGNWVQAQITYENAQNKVKSSGSQCNETEYLLWEDRWIVCAQKLQQWDILTDFAKNENNTDLMIECNFRLTDWTIEKELAEQINMMSDSSSSPRRKVYETFITLMKSLHNNNNSEEYKKLSGEAHQLTLRKWHTLPNVVSHSHISLLHTFQLLVEFDEATKMFTTLANITVQNADNRANDLKSILQSWRDRLPNMWDDINIWSDVVAWRRHVFSVINKAFAQFQLQPNNNNSMAATNYPFRGHHETAWTINRFAHVARKHHLSEVCVNFLQHIYSLPNIEIQEAFLKLREQTKCHYQNPGEVSAALDVINNTNLNYFGPQQKAEFHTLRGMILAKLGRDAEADDSFSRAVQVDMRLPKAWAAWGYYNDRKFKVDPNDTTFAANALSCYLQASGLYNNPKSRKLLIRILWLLSLEDPQNHISQVFEIYNSKSDVPVWYWITFIPQLIVCLIHKEAKHARTILMKIAKQYPQALHYHLRTAREEYMLIKKQAAISQHQARAGNMSSPVVNTAATPTSVPTSTTNAEGMTQSTQVNPNIMSSGNVHRTMQATQSQVSPGNPSPNQRSPNPMSAHSMNFGNQSSPIPPQPPQSPAVQGVNNGMNMSTSSSNIPVQSMQNIQGMNTVSNVMSPAAMPGTPSSGIPGHIPSTSTKSHTSVTTNVGLQGHISTTPSAGNDAGRSPIKSTMKPPPLLNPGMHTLQAMSGTLIPQQVVSKQPWEHVEDIMSILKTSFPLLALTMETMVDQIQQRLKPSADEDIYRLIVALLNDGLQQLITRLNNPTDDGFLTPITEANIKRFADNLYQGAIKTAYEEDFIIKKPNLVTYVETLRKWRDRFEIVLDSKPQKQHLEHFSTYLVEFQHQKFEEVEIPGQYLLLKDHNNTDLIRIDRFLPDVEVVRVHGFCYRRITIRGHDGSLHPFAVQYPSARHSRREERMMQLFRIYNGMLERRKESRKRNLSFHLPLIVPLAPQIRIVEDDSSYCSLQDIYEDHCDNTGISKDDPIIYYTNKMKANLSHVAMRRHLYGLRVEIAEQIATKYIPNDTLTKFMYKTMKSHEDLWTIRKQFTSQMAAVSFMTYVLCVGQRHPHKFMISRNTGNIWTTELLPSFNPNQPWLFNAEAVPFRFTRSIQHFITKIGIEGVFTSAMMSIARCLTEPEFDMGQYIGVFIRDELITWHYMCQKSISEQVLRNRVALNVEQVVHKAKSIACLESDRDKLDKHLQPHLKVVNASLLELIGHASNPQNLAAMEVIWMQWL
ncbi:6786_t:CDS:10 [Funneliformis geosporum]|uniref:13943_t:CDS:1 n=1 Tax=Funneliformis geosporum TaxID=1117311 RepID=A0A9W4WSW8_9GLOM|nr:13943_t:CDS:10 [Funneliformis geosporum]CAI2173217.1 6786_t:CDS:10 [Funneliformis geosporum]